MFIVIIYAQPYLYNTEQEARLKKMEEDEKRKKAEFRKKVCLPFSFCLTLLNGGLNLKEYFFISLMFACDNDRTHHTIHVVSF